MRERRAHPRARDPLPVPPEPARRARHPRGKRGSDSRAGPTAQRALPAFVPPRSTHPAKAPAARSAKPGAGSAAPGKLLEVKLGAQRPFPRGGGGWRAAAGHGRGRGGQGAVPRRFPGARGCGKEAGGRREAGMSRPGAGPAPSPRRPRGPAGSAAVAMVTARCGPWAGLPPRSAAAIGSAPLHLLRAGRGFESRHRRPEGQCLGVGRAGKCGVCQDYLTVSISGQG